MWTICSFCCLKFIWFDYWTIMLPTVLIALRCRDIIFHIHCEYTVRSSLKRSPRRLQQWSHRAITFNFIDALKVTESSRTLLLLALWILPLWAGRSGLREKYYCCEWRIEASIQLHCFHRSPLSSAFRQYFVCCVVSVVSSLSAIHHERRQQQQQQQQRHRRHHLDLQRANQRERAEHLMPLIHRRAGAGRQGRAQLLTHLRNFHSKPTPSVCMPFVLKQKLGKLG